MAQTPKQDRMTPAERMRALLAGQPIDRVPFFPFTRGFCARNVGYPLESFYTDPEKSFWAQVWTQEMYGYDGSPAIGYAAYGAWEFGGEVRFPSSQWEQAPIITRFPVQSEQDVWNLRLPDVKTAGMLPMMMQFSKLQQKFGTSINVTCGSPFTRAGNMCGIDMVCRWMVKKPELAHRLLRLATDHGVEVVQYWVDIFGAERVTARTSTPAEANQVISPSQFEEFAFPYHKELHEKLLAMGVKRFHCHICGEHNLNLPYLARIPMGDRGILSFGHEVDLETAASYFPNHIIAGNVEPQVIQNGTPQQVYELCRIAIEKGKKAPGGYVLMAGCELPVMAPPYNIYVMKKAVDEFGWYDY